MVYEVFERVKKEKPLIHHITNWVSIYDCANITRAFGALPVMAHAREESRDMARIASALVLNIGTLTPVIIESMIVAGVSANEKKIPVILDAVGVGATILRDEKASELLDRIRINIIKGNASEIARLAGENVITKGVESTTVEKDIIPLAKKLSRARKATVVITGQEDMITDSENVYVVKNGHEMMGSIVGTGCMAASIIGAFAGVEKNYIKAAVSALVCFGIAGELASITSKGPGSFHVNFYDEVYNLDKEKIERMTNIEERHA
jgi:hydroxyethylthiazole kinase